MVVGVDEAGSEEPEMVDPSYRLILWPKWTLLMVCHLKLVICMASHPSRSPQEPQRQVHDS